jgi:hypothetical protein
MRHTDAKGANQKAKYRWNNGARYYACEKKKRGKKKIKALGTTRMYNMSVCSVLHGEC